MEEIKTDRRVRKTKESIRNAFITLIMKKDFSKITVKEITQQADISRRTFYMHYNCIDDILNEMNHELSSKVHVLFDNKDFSHATMDDIKEIFAGLNNILNRNYAFYKRLASIHSYGFFVNMLKDVVRDILHTTLKSNFNVEEPVVCAYAEYFSSGIISLYVSWLATDSNVPLDTLVDVAADITYGGMKALIEKPQK